MKISKKSVLIAMSWMFTMASLWLMYVFAENSIDLNVDPNNAIQHFKNVKIISRNINNKTHAIINKIWNLIWIETDYNFVLTNEWKIKCDIDGDWDVDSNDTSEIENYIMTRSPTSQCNQNSCDINNDWMVTTEDLNICVNVVLGQDNFGWGTKRPNQILGWVTWSSILWWNGNMIEKGFFNEILWWKENKIEGGKNNSILGWITNKKWNWNHSVIFWWKNNEITWSYSSIVWWEWNKVTKSGAMAIWNNNTTNGYNSVAMWSGSTLSGQNSFLWTDGNSSEGILEQNNIFAIKWKNWVVVNTTKAHNLAQLTVSGSLIVYDNKKVLECTDNTKWVLKVIDGDVYNNNQKCFCSCDGSWRNALHEWTRCEALCNNEAWLQAECGMVEAICGTIPYSYTWAGTSWACIVWELVEWTWAFLINTQSDNTEWIHRSCQTAYWQVTGCMQQLTWASCPNLRTWYECIWDHEELTWHLITNPNPPVDSATFWKYDPELDKPCTYMCDQYGEWDSDQKKCIFHECRWDLPEGAKLNDEIALPLNDTTDYFYSNTSTWACSYKCNAEFGYYYSGALNKCVTCPEWQTYDEIDGTCKVACDMSKTSFETITIMDESWYAITIADRNLWATSNNTWEVSSYGCYFQWWNNYGFQPQWNLETSTDFVNTRGYGPWNPYTSEIFRVWTGEINNEGMLQAYRPNDYDWSSPANHNLWWWAYDSGNNAFWVLDPNKENRRWPCPEWYHVPSIWERNDLLTLWYNEEYKSAWSGNLPYIKDSGKIISFKWTWEGWLGWAESMRFVKAFRDYFKLPPASSREFYDFAPGVTYWQWWSFWTSSSPRLTGTFTSNSLAKDRVIKIHPNVANSFDYNLIGEGYVWHWLTWRKKWAQSVRCFKDVPECPSWKVWNQSELRCENRTDCDVEHTAIQNLELFLISSTWEISHFTMMDRNLWAFEVYNQKGENEQNARSLWCHFQWWNNNGFSLWAQSTRYGINPTTYAPSSYSNNKIYCKDRNGNTGNEPENELDLNEWWNIFGSQYTPINYHLRWWGYISNSRSFKNWYWSDWSDIDRRWPCPEWYHVPRWIEMNDLVNSWNDASISRWAIWKNFASDLLMPYGRYIEVYCGEQNRLKVWWWIWLSDHIYKYYSWDDTWWHYMNHLKKFTDNSTISFSRNWLAHGYPVRCVKNDMSTLPQKVTIHADGWTGAVIAIDWETEGTGKITALWTPTKNGIDFLWWYSSQSFAAEFKVNTWDYISSGGHLYARWDGCNIVDTAVQDLEVFFLLSPSRISHYVMMDRNLWATEAFNQDISSPNESSYGCYFQWWNNYPFNRGRSGASYITWTLTNTKDYGPNAVNGYYSNSKRHCRRPTGQSGYVMYTADRSGIPFATWLWWWWATPDWDNYRNDQRWSWWIDWTDIDRQWPCPAGYHIPRGIEMETIMQEWKNISDCPYDTGTIALQKAKEFASELLLPFAWFNGIWCPQNEYLWGGTIWNYMISDYIYGNYRNHLHMWISSAGDGLYLYLNGPSFGYSLRCVKNNISDTPQKVTINAYGWTGAVIAIDWETAENGRIVTLWEPKKDGYDFWGWYSDPLFSSRIYTWDNISKEWNLYAKWIAKDCDIANTAIQDLELFFLSETWNISHYMMMDRNLWATEIYNKNSSSQNKKSFGCFFQWWNNYWFPMEIGNTRSTPIDVSSYWPDNYYINSTLFCNGAEWRMYTWLFTDLWWWITNTDISKKWPCPEWYHIPNLYETNMLINGWKSASAWSWIQFASDILLPFAGAISPNCGSGYKNVWGNFWSSDMSANWRTPHHIFILKSWEIGTTSNWVATGFPLRCVKNNLTTSPQKVTIHPDGWTGAVIAIDWESEWSGKIMTLWTPSKLGYSFSWRYSDEWFTNKVNTWDYISSGVNLYAKWDELIAVFMEWSEFNNILSSLAGIKWNINRVKRIDSILSWVTTGLISDVNSPAPIIARYDSWSIYYYSEANKVYLNENSQWMFESFTNLEQIDVSRWNTTNVKTMSGMFRWCSGLLSLDVSNWDTSNVTNMSSMFENCYSLTNLDVSRWNTSNVSDMSRMFVDCSSLEELDVSKWNTSNVTTMFAVFWWNKNYMNLKHLDVSKWDTSKVTTMRSMFRNCIELTWLDVSNWNTSNVENMYMLFWAEYDYMNLEYIDVSKWDTSKVTNMRGTFRNCIKLTWLDVSNWNTSNVIDMGFMFASMAKNGGALPMKLENLDVSNWDTSSVTDMGDMFQNCVDLSWLDVSNWDTSSVTDMWYMFYGCSKLTKLDVSNWDTSNVTNMDAMFYKCSNLTELDLTNRKTNKVTNMSVMFHSNTNLKTIYASTWFVTTKVTSDTDWASLFYDDTKLVWWFGTRYSSSHIHIDYAKIDSESQSWYFTQLKATYLLPWKEFNKTIKRLANNRALDYNSFIHLNWFIQWTWDTIPSWVTTWILSTDDSIYPVYTRFDSWTIYYYTEAHKIYMNPDSSDMFFGFFYGDNVLTSLDLNNWDSSKVINMESMFQHCENLTWINISDWDTSNVTNMSRMFYYCHNLEDLDVSKWNTSNVTDMTAMFEGCRNLTELDVSKWNTSNVTSMQQMFHSCNNLTELDVSNWDTSSVTNMSYMFMLTSNLRPHLLSKLDVSKWDTSSVTDMKEMFYGCDNLAELDVSHWDTSSVINMDGMFKNCSSLTNLNVSKWDTSNVTMMTQMFDGCNNLTELDVSNWDTHNVKYMNGMFKNCSSLTNLNVSKWNTNNVMNTESMFYGCTNLEWLDISKWNTNKVNNMEYMFYNCKNLTELDVSNWNTNRTNYMEYMFGKCINLNTIYSSWWSFNTTYVSSSNNMFSWDTKIIWGFGTRYNSSKLNKEYARIDSEFQSWYFTQLKATYLLPWKQFNQTIKKLAWLNNPTYSTSNTTITQIAQWTWSIIPSWVTTWLISTNDSAYPTYAWFDNSWIIYYYTEANKIYLNQDSSYMFSNCSNLIDLDLNSWDTSNVINMSSMFSNCTSLKKIDIDEWNTSNVTNMERMFWNCNNLAELDVSKWDTSNVIKMNLMFYLCRSLTGLDVSNWNTSNVTDMSEMFDGCSNLTELNVSNFDTSKVTDMSDMFGRCSNLTELDVSNFDTSNVTDMSNMFGSCTNLTELNISNWDTRNVINMEQMFRWCENLKVLDVSNFDTSKVTNMYRMFLNCSSLTWLDVSNFDTSNVTDMSDMFGSCTNLTELNVSNWDTRNVINMERMFRWCENLKVLDVSKWDTSNVIWRMADGVIIDWGMERMFENCTSLENLDVSNWDVSKLRDVRRIFSNCKSLKKLDLSNRDTKNWTNMIGIFDWCSALTELDVSNWDTSNVTEMHNVFKGCSALTWLDVSNWNTSNVTNMFGLFSSCKNLKELDVSKWNTSKVQNMQNIFYGCNNLKTIYASSYFVTSGLKSGDKYHSDMFLGDTKLVWWNGTTYDSSYVDKTYARIDQPWTPWYFTLKQ